MCRLSSDRTELAVAFSPKFAALGTFDDDHEYLYDLDLPHTFDSPTLFPSK